MALKSDKRKDRMHAGLITLRMREILEYLKSHGEKLDSEIAIATGLTIVQLVPS